MTHSPDTIHSVSSTNDEASPPAHAIPAWRRILGVSLFTLSLILPVLALIFVPLLGLPEGVNAVLIGLSLVGGPDVLLIASIALLGKDGVAEITTRLGTWVKRITKWDAVTRTRYIGGLWVAGVSLLLPTLLLFFWTESIATIDGAPGWGFWVLLVSTFAFIGAVIAMGEPFWSRIQALFTWEAKIELPEPQE